MATVNYLIVAGGGGGGSSRGGGGGGGGMLTGSMSISTAGVYPVRVGMGGSPEGQAHTNGEDSVFNGVTATGGGRGGGQNGGSGAGGTGINAGGTTPGGTGIAGQGNNGGTGFNNGTAGNRAGGGGGGAGAVGSNATSGSGGAGGNGSASSISGASVTYAGGGAGGNGSGTGTGGGGTGGGGQRGSSGGAGTNGLGGGGGGANASNSNTSGFGGSGVVILSYTTGALTAIGGTITTSGGNTIHTFLNGGAFTVLPSTDPYYVSSASATGSGGGGPGITVPNPGNLAVGDKLIAIHTDANLSFPSGFTSLVGSFGPDLYVAWKDADAADVAAANFGFSTGFSYNGVAMIVAIRNCASGAPTSDGTSSTNSNTGSPTFTNGITPPAANSLIMQIIGWVENQTDLLTGFSIVTSDPGNWSRIIGGQTQGGGEGICVAFSVRPQTTATGNYSMSGGSSTMDSRGYMLGIAPGSAAPSANSNFLMYM